MKLFRWALGGASAYVIYRYSIGNKAKGEDVLAKPDGDGDKATEAAEKSKPKPRPKRARPKAPKKAEPINKG
ncbi:hypothetical protein GCM10011371_16460 [Novosphingobium marinum]|uniref:Uncharacterized protein n=1 Tax=Novosphingobium marinum TaxID=1514948 RepID=A0A7Y9XW94_9SPHN|nr:hypothetical protein [Novosphingobium marinum]NYH95759.1 hypothetical protein [Novosphingobium marinum]GGC29662.1 hypothetical protein GCM10011371_16460 [Novosphingobium marinum]